jgi:HEAT repeat protein
VLADPLSIPTLLALLSKPQSEVKRLAAWALCRVKPVTNPKVVEELQKLVTNENESIAVRVNAVRALGSIAFDSPQLKIWQTLVTTIQMRGDKYSMLRYYAVRSLGELGTTNPEVAQTLARIAVRDPDPELRKEAVYALRSLPSASDEALAELSSSFIGAGEDELRVRIIEALADLGSADATGLAGELVRGTMAVPLKRRVMQAMAQKPDETTAALILDAAADVKLADFVSALLEGFPSRVIRSVVSRRLRTETDANILSVLNSLDGVLAE